MEKKSKHKEPKPLVIPLPRKFFSDQEDLEREELVRRLGGKSEDWVVVNGFWEVKNQEDK